MNKWEEVNGKRIDAETIGKWFFQVDDPRQAMCIELIEKAIQERVNAQTSRFLAHTTAVTNFLNELYAIMVDPCAEGSISVAEMQKAMLEAARRDREYAHVWGFTEILKAANDGLEKWAAKPGNLK